MTGIAPHISRLFGAVTPEPDDHANPAPSRPRAVARSTRHESAENPALDTKRIRSGMGTSNESARPDPRRSTVRRLRQSAARLSDSDRLNTPQVSFGAWRISAEVVAPQFRRARPAGDDLITADDQSGAHARASRERLDRPCASQKFWPSRSTWPFSASQRSDSWSASSELYRGRYPRTSRARSMLAAMLRPTCSRLTSA